MSCEHFFCIWGCQKEARANLQDHLCRESIPDDTSMTSLGVPEHKLVASKKTGKLPRIPKIGTRGLANLLSDVWKYDGVRFLNKVFQPSIIDVFITIERLWKFSQKVCIFFCRNCERMCSCFWTNFVQKSCDCFWKKSVQLIFFYIEDCVAASGNISMFFLKNVWLLLKRY